MPKVTEYFYAHVLLDGRYSFTHAFILEKFVTHCGHFLAFL